MVENLSKQPQIHFLQDLLKVKWKPANVVGYDVTVTSGESLIKADDSFEKLGEYYPQFTVQMAGDESSGGESGYDFISADGPGQNRLSTLTAQARVEDPLDKDVGYTGDSNTYAEVDAETLVELIRKEIERVCNDNPTAPGTDFSFVSAIHGQIPDESNSSRAIRKDGAVIQYGWLKD